MNHLGFRNLPDDTLCYLFNQAMLFVTKLASQKRKKGERKQAKMMRCDFEVSLVHG